MTLALKVTVTGKHAKVQTVVDKHIVALVH